MSETLTGPRKHLFAQRLTRWLGTLRREPSVDLHALSDRMLKDAGLDRGPLDQRTIRSQHDAMRYSG